MTEELTPYDSNFVKTIQGYFGWSGVSIFNKIRDILNAKIAKLTTWTANDIVKVDAAGELVTSGKQVPSGNVVGTTDTQALSNKTISNSSMSDSSLSDVTIQLLYSDEEFGALQVTDIGDVPAASAPVSLTATYITSDDAVNNDLTGGDTVDKSQLESDILNHKTMLNEIKGDFNNLVLDVATFYSKYTSLRNHVQDIDDKIDLILSSIRQTGGCGVLKD